MYKCSHCSSVFDEPEETKTTYEELYGVSGDFADCHTAYVYTCPYCGCTEFDSYIEAEDEEM